jgi:hypothetical protein
VVDDLGRLGRVWREADYEATDFETVVTDLLEGQYKNPIGIFAFNTAEGWARENQRRSTNGRSSGPLDPRGRRDAAEAGRPQGPEVEKDGWRH